MCFASHYNIESSHYGSSNVSYTDKIVINVLYMGAKLLWILIKWMFRPPQILYHSFTKSANTIYLKINQKHTKQ